MSRTVEHTDCPACELGADLFDCDGCGAESGERCRQWCLGSAVRDDADRYGNHPAVGTVAVTRDRRLPWWLGGGRS